MCGSRSIPTSSMDALREETASHVSVRSSLESEMLCLFSNWFWILVLRLYWSTCEFGSALFEFGLTKHNLLIW